MSLLAEPPPTLFRLRELRKRLQVSGVLRAFDARLEGLLPDATRTPLPSDKIFKDRVWGTIRVPGKLVPLLDTRMLQRQRRIRQLGLSYLVYPSVGYSRFEHALGCFHAMESLLASVRAHSDMPTKVVLDERRQTQLLLGALLHDVGHMPFSHASERALEVLISELRIGPQSAKEVLDQINDAVDKNNVRLAEALSVLVLLSERTHSFLRHLVPTEEAYPEDFFLEIAAFITGARLRDSDLACAQILSGPVDADKLDYMTRDAMVSGVPVSVDISRLLARCSFRSVSRDNLPQNMREQAESDRATLFVTELAGTNALEELTISRFILYDRIYNHHKTKAAESILHELLLRGLECGVVPRDVPLFWAMTDEGLLHTALSDPATRELSERLLYRDLPKRAVVYAEKLIARPVLPLRSEAQAEVSAGPALTQQIMPLLGLLLDDIDGALGIDGQRKALQEAIRQRAVDLSRLLDPDAGYQPKEPLRIITVCPRPSSPFNASSEALVIDLDGRISTFRKHMPIDQWSAAFSLNKRFGYVFTDHEWTPLVHIATEQVLWERFCRQSDQIELHFRLTEPAQSQAKLECSRIHRMKRLLDDKGAFDRSGPLRPLEVKPARLEPLVQRFAAFQGAGGWLVSADSLECFVRQFPMRLQSQVCQMLDGVQFLERSVLIEAVDSLLTKISKELSSASIKVVALTPNSGGLVRMLAEADLRHSHGEHCKFSTESLAAVVKTADTVVFVDDLLSSGSQASAQLQAWMGVPRAARRDPNEQNISDVPLPTELVEKFKEMPLHLALACGTEAGRQLVLDTASELGLKQLRVHFHKPMVAPPAERLSPEVREHLERIGTELLVGVRGEADRAACQRDALGYEGRTALIVSLFNVPTCCPAALWCPGRVSGTPWVPLFIRRGYQQRAVFV